MSGEIINIYQFIRDFKASNGGTDGLIEAADQNDDGVILKHEFEDFLDSNWSGGGFPEDDIIEQFWKSIDVNKSEARIYKTDLKNYRAVTADEIDRVEKVVANYEELQGFLKTLKAPSNLSTRQQTKWLNEMKGKLTDYYNAWMTGEIKDEFALKTTYNEYVKEITPYHAAEDKMTQFVDTNSYIKSLGYDWTIDWKGTLGRNVSNHIKEYLKNNPNATGEQIVSETFKIVNAMISNADFRVSGEKAEEFKQAKFTELQRIQIEDILKDDPEVMEVMSPYSSVIVDKVFNKFYSFYYNYNNSKGGNFKIAKTDAPEVFLQWFAEYGEEIIEGLGGTLVDPVTEWNCTFSGVNSSYTIASGDWITINGSVSVKKGTSNYTNITLKLDSWVGIYEFEKTSTGFSMDTETMTGPRTVTRTIQVVDNATNEIIGTKTITLNIQAPAAPAVPSNQDIVKSLGSTTLNTQPSDANGQYGYNYWVANNSHVAEDIVGDSLLGFKNLYENNYCFLAASSNTDYTNEDNARLGYDDEGLCSFDRMLDYPEGSDYECAIDNWIINLGKMVKSTLMTSTMKFNSALLSRAVDNITTKYIDDLRKDPEPEILADNATAQMITNAINSKSNKSGYQVYEDNARTYLAVSFKAFVDDILNEYKRLGGTF